MVCQILVLQKRRFKSYCLNSLRTLQGGYRGFYAKNTITLTPKVVNDIHKRGGTILGTSRGGHDTTKIVDSIQDRGINQVYIIGGDGTQRGASVIFDVRMRSCGKNFPEFIMI